MTPCLIKRKKKKKMSANEGGRVHLAIAGGTVTTVEPKVSRVSKANECCSILMSPPVCLPCMHTLEMVEDPAALHDNELLVILQCQQHPSNVRLTAHLLAPGIMAALEKNRLFP